MSAARPEAPDFLIIGAMKCGTTTLHAILDRHPQVFLPPNEVFFFDIDDFIQHPDFFPFDGERWEDRDFEARAEAYWRWYAKLYAAAKPGQLRGDESTTYLAAARAPERVAAANPQARLVVMLRDPVERAYSNYWHLLRHGRVFLSFEDTLRLQPESLLDRSLYERQIRRWLRYFPREQLHAVLLEELVATPMPVLESLCRFLGIRDDVAGLAELPHRNRGDAPRHPWLARWRNRLLWERGAGRHLSHLPESSTMPVRRQARWWRGLDALHRRVNPVGGKPAAMAPATRRFLRDWLGRENQGLGTLIGKDLQQWWYRECA